MIAPLLPGETLAGKYRIERVLGQGGMGIVVSARHLELDERVAIKFLIGPESDGAAERFLREARAAAKVKGEHVCRVFDFGRLESGEPYIVMDHLEGIDLARKLEREGPQPYSQVVGWVTEICDALADAHASGIVHRDLKPANIFLAARPDGSTCAKVLDFGISKLARAETMTGPAISMGSPVYMSPEQMESARDVDARSDIWSLGVLMYELIAGRPPFVADSMVQLTVLVRERREEPLEIVRPEVPELLARVVTRCLHKKPADRFSTVADLASALAAHAPDEVAPLLTRLARRKTPEPALALAQTSPDDARRTPPTLERTETSVTVALSRDDGGTFAPVQSSVAQRNSSAPVARRRWAAPALGLAVAVVTLGALRSYSSGSHDSSVAPNVAGPSRTEPIAAVVAEMPSAPIEVPVPVASTNATMTATTAAPLRPPVPARQKVVVPGPVAAAAVPASSTAAVQIATASVLSVATTRAATPATRSKRELDRDDP